MILKHLNNKDVMPILGYGTFQIGNNYTKKSAKEFILKAFKIGYRHIDTAMYYLNEREIGEAIKTTKVDRKEMFITTKYYPSAENIREGFIEYTINLQLEMLQIDYIDLYLLHFPRHYNTNLALWRIFEKFQSKGILKSIGVSNFSRNHLDHLLKNCKIVPQMNQINISPYHYPYKVIDFCWKNKIDVTGYSMFKDGSLENKNIIKIAKEKSKTSAQVILRWAIQKNIFVIPKSQNFSRMKSNFEIFDFSLTKKEMEIIDALNQSKPQLFNPEAVVFMDYHDKSSQN